MELHRELEARLAGIGLQEDIQFRSLDDGTFEFAAKPRPGLRVDHRDLQLLATVRAERMAIGFQKALADQSGHFADSTDSPIAPTPEDAEWVGQASKSGDTPAFLLIRKRPFFDSPQISSQKGHFLDDDGYIELSSEATRTYLASPAMDKSMVYVLLDGKVAFILPATSVAKTSTHILAGGGPSHEVPLQKLRVRTGPYGLILQVLLDHPLPSALEPTK